MPNIVQKTFPPNKMISEPYGTIYEIHDDQGRKLFIQMSKDVENPHWLPMGDFLLKAFENEISNKEFIESCIFHYENHAPK